MIHWKQIKDLEKIISEQVIKLYNDYELEDDIDKFIIDPKYKIIHFKKEENNLTITFKNCILKNKFITNKSDLQDICCVCYESCDNTLKCGHYLCNTCMNNWLQKNNSCPMCRNENHYQTGYYFTLPLRIIKLSLYNQSCLCFKKKSKRLRPAHYLYYILQNSRTFEENNYVYKWIK